MGKRIKGFNIILMLNGKKVAGTTTNSFGIKPKVKESFIKDDNGVSQSEVTGFDSDFSVNGLMILNEAGESDNFEDFDTLRTATMAGMLIPFVYGDKTVGGKTLSGTLLITDYKEDTGAEDTGTYSITCKVSPAVLTPGVNSTVAQVANVTLSGVSGSAVITGPGQLVKALSFDTSLTATAAAFVSVCAAAYLAKGIIVTSQATKIIFTGATPANTFVVPVITTVSSNLGGVVS